jgi:hypothetical protein
MRATVAITGWNAGLQKVSLTTLIQTHVGMTLTAAKQCTDNVLEGRPVLLRVASSEDAAAFCAALLAIGARAEVRDAG